MEVFRYLFSFLLEPIGHIIYLIVFGYILAKGDRAFGYRVLCAHYLITSALLIKALLVTDNNIYIYNMLFVFTSLAYAYYFFSSTTSTVRRMVAVGAGSITLLYFLANQTILPPELAFDSTGYVLASAGIVVSIFFYFRDILKNVSDEPISHNFDFWFICAQLIYHLGNFGIFLSFNYLTHKILPAEHYSNDNRDMLTYLWGLHNVLLFVSAVVTAIGLAWISSQSKKRALP